MIDENQPLLPTAGAVRCSLCERAAVQSEPVASRQSRHLCPALSDFLVAAAQRMPLAWDKLFFGTLLALIQNNFPSLHLPADRQHASAPGVATIQEVCGAVVAGSGASTWERRYRVRLHNRYLQVLRQRMAPAGTQARRRFYPGCLAHWRLRCLWCPSPWATC